MSKRKFNIYPAFIRRWIIFSLLSFPLLVEAKVELISGRHSNEPLYRLHVPDHWKRKAVELTTDTQKPIAEFQVEGVRITVHNFPSIRIPPQAQVDRWNKQSNAEVIENQSFAGFQGLFFENNTTLAWALEWGACRRQPKEIFSDVTFKAVGAVGQFREEIIKSARSFEVIEDQCEW